MTKIIKLKQVRFFLTNKTPITGPNVKFTESHLANEKCNEEKSKVSSGSLKLTQKVTEFDEAFKKNALPNISVNNDFQELTLPYDQPIDDEPVFSKASIAGSNEPNKNALFSNLPKTEEREGRELDFKDFMHGC